MTFSLLLKHRSINQIPSPNGPMLHVKFSSSTPWRTCCEVRVMLCMTFFFCAPLQSARGFILEGDWTPTKMNLFYAPPIEVGVLSPFKIKNLTRSL